ncbi:MAG TPA: hypothetical protein VGN80_17010 [Devosiaceae bacterium]|jgi:hypothetical protein|nr:hypothetical protein [Devosiaceae bacterium]
MSTTAPNTSANVSRFAGTLLDLLDRVEYRRVPPEDQFNPVYKLRYEAYRREDFVPINSQEIVRDEFDELPNVRCYGVYIDGELVSSVRFHQLTSDFRTSPSHSVFGDIIDPILDEGHTVLDPGRFTADYEASLAYPALPYLTLRIPTIAVLYYSAKYCLNSVRPEHGAFYKRVYRSVALSEPRYYHGLSFPMVLYACDLIPIYDDLVRRYPFFRSTEEERERMFGPMGRSGLDAIRPSARQAQEFAERHHETV